MRPKLDFWFDFASTYAYLTAMRIERLAANAGVEVRWRPFLLGPIFKSQGWTTSPFNLYPAKGRYMIRDCERLAAARGIVFHIPSTFPQNSISAARMMLALEQSGQAAAFARTVFEHEFARQRDIGDAEVLRSILAFVIDDFSGVLEASSSEFIKNRLREETETAARLGIFGAPTFIAHDGEMFWGDDRLEAALAWSCEH